MTTVAIEGSNTQTATVGTEHSLHTNAGAKVFILAVNAVNMVNSDIVELRMKTKVLTGDTIGLTYMATFAHVQTELIKLSVPMPAGGFTSGSEFTLKQTEGTARNFPWAVWSIGTVVVEDSNTQTAVVGTEHTLNTNSLAKPLTLAVNTVNMANGDVLELRIKTKVLTGDAVGLAYLATFANIQTEIIKLSRPTPTGGLASATVFTLKQTAGTARNFPWAIWST